MTARRKPKPKTPQNASLQTLKDESSHRVLFPYSLAAVMRFGLVAILVYLATLSVYLANKRAIPGLDTLPGRFVALSLIRDGDLDLDEFLDTRVEGSLKTAARETNGHFLSDYPIAAPVLAVPYYKMALLAGIQAAGGQMIWMEKWAAANLGALAATLFWFVLFTTGAPWPARVAAWISIVFGSPLWTPSSQGLWQHATLAIFTCAALLTWPPAGATRPMVRLMLCGVLVGLAATARPTAAVLLPVWVVVALLQARPRIPSAIALAVGGVFGLLPLFTYHTLYFGTPIGGGYFRKVGEERLFSIANAFENILPHLFAPSRGVLLFCPFLFLLPWAFLKNHAAVRPPHFPRLLCVLSAAVIVALFLPLRIWWGGYSYGPRFWADIMPFLGVLLLPGFSYFFQRRGWRSALAAALVIWAVLIQAVGAWRYDGGWDEAVNIDKNPSAAWRPFDNTVLYCITGGLSHTGVPKDANEVMLPFGLTVAGQPGFEKYLRSGFHPVESWGVWSRGGYDALMHFKLPRITDGKLLLDMMAPGQEFLPKKVRFYINGHKVGEHEFDQGATNKFATQRIEIPVSASTLTGHLEILRISDPGGYYPDAGFSRFIGVGVSALGWDVSSGE